jgi:hypothetical protein
MTASPHTLPTRTALEVGAVTRLAVADPPSDLAAAVAVAVDQVRPDDGARLLAVTGSDVDPSARVRALDAMVTRRRVESDAVRIHHDVLATAEDGTVAYRVGLRWSVPGDDTTPSVRQLAVADIASVEWGRRLADRLAGDDGFVSSVSTFDGTIGLVSGDEQVRFRIYRGRIVETAHKSLDGSTFDITADERTWVELLLGEYDDYVRFAARGRFRVLGSGFQYLRMTRTVRLMVAAARAMARENDADQR